MRIIGGELKRRKLTTVSGYNTRPTSDRNRESLFNIISGRIRGAYVLDLYAGTGALGIESVSRGAHSCTFIESFPDALAAIKKNITQFGIEKKTKIIKSDITRGLGILKGTIHKFDLVFMDPPYDKDLINKTLESLVGQDCLAEDFLVVIEHSPKEKISPPCQDIVISDRRKYGKTAITFLTPPED